MEIVQFLVLFGILAISHAEEIKSAIPGSLEKILNTRTKRDTDTSKSGFTVAEKQIILDKHNEFRRVPNAADMQLMFWDNELEGIAQEWVEKCKFVHNDDRMTESGATAGENLYISSGGYDATMATISWNDEVSDYTFSSNMCADGAQCGHYTQVVWATSYKVGCGIKFCPSSEGTSISDGYLVACNYIGPGNFVGQKPYTEGAACSSCPAGKETCDDGLCTDGSSVTIPPPATTTEGSGATHIAATSSTLLVCLLAYLSVY